MTKEQKENHVVVLIGVPCSGKTTYSDKHYPAYTRMSWDDTMLELYPSDSYGESFKIADDKEVRKVMYKRLSEAVDREENIVMDLTHMGSKMRLKHLSGLPVSYKRTAVICVTPIGDIHARNAERAKLGKEIPGHVLDSMLQRYEEPTKEEFDEIILNCNSGV